MKKSYLNSNMKYYKILIAIITVNTVLMQSCTNKKEEIINLGINFKIDYSLYLEANLSDLTDKDDLRNIANYPLMYIGKFKKEIQLKDFVCRTLLPLNLNKNKKKFFVDTNIYKNYFVVDYFFQKKTKKDTNGVEIVVDNLKKIFGYNPVLIKNKSIDTLSIGSDSFLYPILQKKIGNENYVDIQSRRIIGCGTGIASLLLPPNEIAITLVPIIKRNNNEKLRLKMGKDFSNEY